VKVARHCWVALASAMAASFSAPFVGETPAAEPLPVKRVRLTVEESGGVDRIAWPVTQGVPFGEGDFPVDTPARVVLEDGKSLPPQTLCLATWSKDRKFVKWLLVDFQIDLKANQTRQVYLEYGPAVQAPEPTTALTVTHPENDKILRVDTGPMQLELRTDSADFFSACRVRTENGWRDLLSGKPGAHLYMTDQEGRRYQSNQSRELPKIQVEDAGPLRASVCIRGRHASADGQSFCPYVLRIHAYAGRSDLRVYHTFVFTGDADRHEFTEVGMNFPVDLGGDVKIAFGGSAGAHEITAGKTALFLQTSDLEYMVSRDGEAFARGDKNSGWASLSGRGGSVIVALRDLWQEYPKGIELTAGRMDLQFWPKAYGERLVFRTPWDEEAIFFNRTRSEEQVKKLLAARPTAPLNLKSFAIFNEDDLIWVEEMLRKYAPERTASYNDTGTFDGYGAAKTHEFVLRLSPRAAPAEACEAFGRCVQEPVVAPADPAHTCATGALRHAYHRGDPMFQDVDAGLDALVETVILEPRRLCRRYGMWTWGSLMCSHASGVTYVYRYHKNNGTPMIASKYIGPYNNESNDQVWNVWFNFVRTANREHFLLAESVSEQMADVAICHTGGARGLMHYHNAHHWSGGHSPSHTLIGGIMLHYYFTGNRRMLEIAREVADWAVRRQEPCGIVSNRHLLLTREFASPLLCVLDVYQATWEEAYGRLAKRSLTWLLRTQETPGTLPATVFTRGEKGDEAWVIPGNEPGHHGSTVYPIYYDAYRLFDSELLRKTILAEADQHVFKGAVHNYFTAEMAEKMLPDPVDLYRVDDRWYWCHWIHPQFIGYGNPIVCVAYDITADPLYAAWADYILHEYFVDRAERVKNLAPFKFTYTCFAQPISALMQIVHDAATRDPEAFRKARAEWRRRREANGVPLYTGPHDWLPRDQAHFDAGGRVLGAELVRLKGRPRDERDRTPRSIGRISPDEEDLTK